MVESIRDTLDEIERQLQDQIDVLRKQLAALERELSDLRLAKAALGPRDQVVKVGIAGETNTALPVKAIISFANSPYEKLTMKQLTVKALEEHFKNGATAKQLIKYFADAWQRTDISRASLSPQLSRLKNEGAIYRMGRTWYLTHGAQNNEALGPNEPGAPSHHVDGNDTLSSSGS